jgi:hypothetical protein
MHAPGCPHVGLEVPGYAHDGLGRLELHVAGPQKILTLLAPTAASQVAQLEDVAFYHDVRICGAKHDDR